MKKFYVFFLIFILFTFHVYAKGQKEDQPSSEVKAQGGYPLRVVDDLDNELTLEKQPERILSGTLMTDEMLLCFESLFHLNRTFTELQCGQFSIPFKIVFTKLDILDRKSHALYRPSEAPLCITYIQSEDFDCFLIFLLRVRKQSAVK